MGRTHAKRPPHKGKNNGTAARKTTAAAAIIDESKVRSMLPFSPCGRAFG
jgi:hypothetical protein